MHVEIFVFRTFTTNNWKWQRLRASHSNIDIVVRIFFLTTHCNGTERLWLFWGAPRWYKTTCVTMQTTMFVSVLGTALAATITNLYPSIGAITYCYPLIWRSNTTRRGSTIFKYTIVPVTTIFNFTKGRPSSWIPHVIRIRTWANFTDTTYVRFHSSAFITSLLPRCGGWYSNFSWTMVTPIPCRSSIGNTFFTRGLHVFCTITSLGCLIGSSLSPPVPSPIFGFNDKGMPDC